MLLHRILNSREEVRGEGGGDKTVAEVNFLQRLEILSEKSALAKRFMFLMIR